VPFASILPKLVHVASGYKAPGDFTDDETWQGTFRVEPSPSLVKANGASFERESTLPFLRSTFNESRTVFLASLSSAPPQALPSVRVPTDEAEDRVS